MNSTAEQIGDPQGPLDLLRSVEEADEVLVLSYTANLDYFERFVLTETRRLEAIATIVSDPSMLVADPLAITGAGLRYTSAFARCPGGTAFHPKLLVIAGRDQATVAVGSGNMTLAGWHSSEEIWTVFNSDRQRGPSTLRGVSRFLRQLSGGPVQVSSSAFRALERTAELLDGLKGNEPGPELVSTLDGPILEKLPAGPVDELIVHSPFYDSQLDALATLHDLMKPNSIRIFVQAKTSVDGDALAGWASQNGAELLWCRDGAYRHGKLVEWSVGGRRWTLTGSPNLSAPALLAGIGEPGRLANCELGLIGTTEESLAPPESASQTHSVKSLEFSPGKTHSAEAGIVVLGASITDQGDLVIELAQELGFPAKLQIYDESREWFSVPDIGEFAPGEAQLSCPPLAPGTAIRLASGGVASNEIFVSDPRRAQRKPIKWVGPDIGAPEEFAENGDLNSLFGLVAEMREIFVKSGYMVVSKPGGTGDTSDKEESYAPAPGQTLADYLSVTPAVLPDSVVMWSLSLPPVPGLRLDPGLEGTGGMLTTETGDSAADAGEAEVEAPLRTTVDRMRDGSARRRRQLRRFCDQSLSVASDWPNLFRALIGRFVLSGIAADLWPEKVERSETLVTLIKCLATPQDEPSAEEAEAISCYLAIALAILRFDVARLSVEDEANLRFKAACTEAAGFDFVLDAASVEQAADELKPTFGQVVSSDNVLRVVRSLVEAKSPNETAIELILEEEGIQVEEESGVLVVKDALPRVYESALLRVASFVRGPSSTIRAETEQGVSVACVWEEPLLLISSENKLGRRGRLYKGPGARPSIIVAGWDYGDSVPHNLPSPVADWMQNEGPPSDAIPLLRRISC